MSLHTELPIYKRAYDLLNLVTDLIKQMPRDSKQSIGHEISSECVKIDRVEGRDAASSRRVPSHDGLCPGTTTENE